MKNYKKGFVAPLLLVFIVLIALGGGAYYYAQKSKAPPATVSETVTTLPTSTSTTVTKTTLQNEDTVAWKTYTNTKKGYTITYPIDAKINSTDSSCVRIDRGFGFITINVGSSDPCGQPTGVGIGDIRISENIFIGLAGDQYTASGWRTPDNFGYLSFNFNNKIFVTYGVAHVDKSNPNSWKDLGSLSDSEYQNALYSVKHMAETMTSI